MSVCLDAFALLAWLQDEAGAAEVESYLVRAAEEEDFRMQMRSRPTRHAKQEFPWLPVIPSSKGWSLKA